MSSKAISILSAGISLYQLLFSHSSSNINNKIMLKQLNKFFTGSVICIVFAISFAIMSLVSLEIIIGLALMDLQLSYLIIASILFGFNFIVLFISIYSFIRVKRKLVLGSSSYSELISSSLVLAKQILK